MASERLSTTSLDSTLQKAIPKKPPPPAPVADLNSNGSPSAASSEQAPALPPKPNNQFNPFLQQRPLPQPTTQLRAVREQARVIYAYKPSNNDELEMEVGDIIDVLDKNTEDQGWWKGELNGKIGVFPDNFVQLIGIQEMPPVPQQQQPDWHNNSRLSGSAASNHSNNTSNSGGYPHQQPRPLVSSSTEGRIKSVFAGTPKGFSKELESNLEKKSNPASFLSLKRDKLQHQRISSGLPTDTSPTSMSSLNNNPNQQLFDHHHQLPATPSLNTSNPTLSSILTSTDTSPIQNGHASGAIGGPLDISPGKLNHITANRAKGPTRRPPKNLLNKRFQQNELASNNNNISNSNNIKQEPSELKDEITIPASLPTFNNTNNSSNHNSHQATTAPQMMPPPVTTGGTPPRALVLEMISPSVDTSPSSVDHLQPANNKQTTAPTSTMAAAMAAAAGTMTAPPSTGSTPPWMVELRKTNSEKKRDPPQPIPQPQTIAPPTTMDTVNNVVATSEITELRNEVKKLQDDFKVVHELKSALEVMKIELRACQSATESQRRYIKELVSNLADERKKIASMQVEIDRNLSDQL